MSIVAKFRCVEKTSRTSTYAYGPPQPVDSEEVKFAAVTGEGNDEWSKWTPSGELRMVINNPDAINQFEVGKDYLINITPAE